MKMVEKFKQWYRSKRKSKPVQISFTEEQLKTAYQLGYNDGRRDGLAIAREQATKSLKEILWQQNKK